jgi:homocysteine S-methyltransferase
MLLDSAVAQPLVLDGGLGTTLESAGADVSSALWSARLLRDEPERITAAHRAFFAAGASIAITASYQVTSEGLGPETDAALIASLRLAEQARAEFADDGVHRWVAASIGPYGAMLADGSEYRGDYGLNVRQLADWHRPRMRTLERAGAELFAVETLPSVLEVEAVVAALEGGDVPAWICVTPADGRTRDGRELGAAFALAAASDAVLAVGVNCCAPAEVLPAIRAARTVTDKPVVVYPNSGENWDAQGRRWHGDAAFAPDLVESWLRAGASIVGGCCRVGPAQIAAIADSMAAAA